MSTPFISSMTTSTSLRTWSEIHIDENVGTLRGIFDNALFYGCKFICLAGVTLRNCCLTQSKFDPQTVDDLLGLTVTLDCFSFADVELNELALDYLLLLLCRTRGNREKRSKIIKDIIGRERAKELLSKIASDR